MYLDFVLRHRSERVLKNNSDFGTKQIEDCIPLTISGLLVVITHTQLLLRRFGIECPKK